MVIGETARVGRQCHFLHGVTLGSRELSGAFNKKKLQSTFSTSQMSEPTLFPLDPAISTTATNSVVARHPSIGDYVMIGCNACILGRCVKRLRNKKNNQTTHKDYIQSINYSM